MSNIIPSQATQNKDIKWKKSCVDGFISRTSETIGRNSDRELLLKLYNYYNGYTYEEDYQYVLQPYGGKQITNFPAQLRTYPLIKPAVDLLVGEKLKRPLNFNCINTSGDVVTIKEEAKKQVIVENLYQWFANKLNEEGVETGVESKEVELPEKVEQMFERTWKDHRTILAQKASKFLINYVRWKEKHQKGWFDFLVSGYVVTHKGIRNNEPFYNILNPIDVYHDDDPEIDFIEDGSWVVVREFISRSSIVDRFYQFLTTDEIQRLENPQNKNSDAFFWHQRNNQVFDEHDDYTEVCTVYWKSLKRIGIRTYIDDFGDILEEEVDADYKKSDLDIDVQYEWVNEVWKGHRIDGDIYVDIEPIYYQRSSLDNPSKCKLPVNGRKYSARNSKNISFVMMGIPFQITYDIFKYRLEAAIAKSRDMLAMFDINMIPEGWDMDKFMAIMDATGIAWLDFAKEGLQFNPQYQAVLDLSIKTIEQYLKLLEYIRQEWEQISGVTRQRMGDTSPYELKSTTEQSIIQSSHITEDMFFKYNRLEERDLQGLIDVSQFAWVNGKKAMYIMPDGTADYLDLDEEYALAEIGIFVTDSLEEMEKLQKIQQLTSVALEQGNPLSAIADLIGAESFVELKEKIKEAEKNMQEMQQAQQEAEQQMLEQQEASKQADRDHDKELKSMELNNKIELELIKQAQDSTDSEDWKQTLEERKVELEQQLKNRELSEKERNNKAKEEIERKKVAKMSAKKTGI